VKACRCTTDGLPYAWKCGHLPLHDPALEGDGTPLSTCAIDDGGLTCEGWPKARLVLLPKKGGHSPARNWQGIYLLGIGYKVLSSTMVKRMQAPMEQVAFEMQAGFRPELETIDGLFAVMMGLKKRQERTAPSLTACTWTWSRRSER